MIIRSKQVFWWKQIKYQYLVLTYNTFQCFICVSLNAQTKSIDLNWVHWNIIKYMYITLLIYLWNVRTLIVELFDSFLNQCALKCSWVLPFSFTPIWSLSISTGIKNEVKKIFCILLHSSLVWSNNESIFLWIIFFYKMNSV